MEPSSPPVPAAATETSTEDNTVAFVAYLTLIGFIIAIVMHSNKKTRLGAFHLRQVLGLFLTGVPMWICSIVLAFIPILGWLAILGLWVTLFVFVVIGFIAALNRQMKPVPVVGPLYQKWFANAFN